MMPLLESAAMPDPTEVSPSIDPTTTGVAPCEESRMSFGDHLDELRLRLILSLVGVAVASVGCLLVGKSILSIIYAPLLIVQHANGMTPTLTALSPTAGFTAYLKIGFLSGLIISMPWVIYQIWRFVATGLYQHERRFLKLLAPASTGLFAIGVAFMYYVVLPVVLQFFVSFNMSFPMDTLSPNAFQKLLLPKTAPVDRAAPPAVAPLHVPVLSEDPAHPKSGDAWINERSRRFITKTSNGVLSVALEPGATPAAVQSQFAIDFYISFVLMLSLAFGIAFETPIIVFFLAWSGLVSTVAMCAARRYILLGTVVAAAILTPPDIISQMLLAGPMYMLFELGLLVARFATKKVPADAGG